jgi:hypothetical protein
VVHEPGHGTRMTGVDGTRMDGTRMDGTRMTRGGWNADDKGYADESGFFDNVEMILVGQSAKANTTLTWFCSSRPSLGR